MQKSTKIVGIYQLGQPENDEYCVLFTPTIGRNKGTLLNDSYRVTLLHGESEPKADYIGTDINFENLDMRDNLITSMSESWMDAFEKIVENTRGD